MLGAINLSEFVDINTRQFDYSSFEEAVAVCVKGLNLVLDEGMNLHPLQEQRDSVRDWRQIGLGVMGLGDMLVKMRVLYGSDMSLAICDRIGIVMAETAIGTSALLAKEYGPYPKYSKNVMKSAFYLKHRNPFIDSLVEKYGLRNSQLLTIPPTGSISNLFGVSGGLEPIYANSYTRKTESLHGHDVYYKVFTKIVGEYMKEHGLSKEEELPNYFVTSSTIDPFTRVNMQGVWQQHIDASISSTVNLPEETTVELVRNLYISAWKAGLKGMTIFRNNCKRCGVLTIEPKDNDKDKDKNCDADKSESPSIETLPRGAIIECSDNLLGLKRKIQTGCGSLHVEAFFDEETGDMQEVYLSKGSTGGCTNFMIGLSRTISLLCRAGVDVYTIKDQLDSTGACPSYTLRSGTKHDTSKGSCCPMAIGNALIDMYEDFNRRFIEHDKDEQDKDEQEEDKQEEDKLEEDDIQGNTVNKTNKTTGMKCPSCGSTLTAEGGCVECKNCGWSKCD